MVRYTSQRDAWNQCFDAIIDGLVDVLMMMLMAKSRGRPANAVRRQGEARTSTNLGKSGWVHVR